MMMDTMFLLCIVCRVLWTTSAQPADEFVVVSLLGTPPHKEMSELDQDTFTSIGNELLRQNESLRREIQIIRSNARVKEDSDDLDITDVELRVGMMVSTWWDEPASGIKRLDDGQPLVEVARAGQPLVEVAASVPGNPLGIMIVEFADEWATQLVDSGMPYFEKLVCITVHE